MTEEQDQIEQVPVVAEQQVVQEHQNTVVTEQQQILKIYQKHMPEAAEKELTLQEIQVEMVDLEAEAEAETDKIHLQQAHLE